LPSDGILLRKFFSHANGLRSLAGKQECNRVNSHNLILKMTSNKGRTTQPLTPAACAAPNSFAIESLMRCSANSAATRIAFLMAFAFDDPCVMKHTPFTPNSGAPPYSVWSRRFLKSEKALRDRSAPTCRVMVERKLSFKVA